MYRFWFKILLTSILSSFCLLLNAQTSASDQIIIKNKKRVNYIYNITNYIQWQSLQNEFVVGVLGEFEEGLILEFLNKSKIAKIKNLQVKIKYFKTLTDITKTDLLYLHNRNNYRLEDLLSIAYNNQTLLVSENYPFKTSMINFIELGDDFHFEVDEAKINAAGLLVDPNLHEFAIQNVDEWNKLYTIIKQERDVVAEQKLKLDILSNQIQTTSNNLAAQQSVIEKQTKSIELQKNKLQNQTETLNSKVQEVNAKNNELGNLLVNIDAQKKHSEKLLDSLNNRTESIKIQDSLLKYQNIKYEQQQKDILKQAKLIEQQKSELTLQLEKIEQQTIINYLFGAFLLAVLLFIIFVTRAYNKQKEAERALKSKNIELTNMNNSLDSFVYRVSHDLKSPIINVQNMLSMLSENVEEVKTPLLPQIMSNMQSSSERLIATITDLLELVKIEKTNEAAVELNLKTLFQNLLTEYKAVLKDINANVKYDFSGFEMISATETEVYSVFQNLLSNSIKYKSKSRNLEVKLTTKVLDIGDRQITFEDNGIGIDLKRHDHKMFSMFNRFTKDSKIKGTGVGMYIIKKIITKYNGTIYLESKIDEGLKYFIKFQKKK